MLTSQEAIDAYAAACNTADPETRRRLLEQALTPDALVVYPNTEAHGWDGILAAIDTLQQQVPGVRVVLTSGIEAHHGWMRVAWRLCAADGAAIAGGEDVAEVAGDGRLHRIIGFHDPLPPPRGPR